MIKILIVDDDKGMVETCAKLFLRQGFSTVKAYSGEEAIEKIKIEQDVKIIITDIRMGQMNGFELLKKIKEHSPAIEVIMMTGYGTIQDAVTAIKMGASDYIIKPFTKDQIMICINRLFKIMKLETDVAHLQSQLNSKYSIENIIGESKLMKNVFDRIRASASVDCPVLILGETGVGKNLLQEQYII